MQLLLLLLVVLHCLDRGAHLSLIAEWTGWVLLRMEVDRRGEVSIATVQVRRGVWLVNCVSESVELQFFELLCVVVLILLVRDIERQFPSAEETFDNGDLVHQLINILRLGLRGRLVHAQTIPLSIQRICIHSSHSDSDSNSCALAQLIHVRSVIVQSDSIRNTSCLPVSSCPVIQQALVAFDLVISKLLLELLELFGCSLLLLMNDQHSLLYLRTSRNCQRPVLQLLGIQQGQIVEEVVVIHELDLCWHLIHLRLRWQVVS